MCLPKLLRLEVEVDMERVIRMGWDWDDLPMHCLYFQMLPLHSSAQIPVDVKVYPQA